MNARYEILTAEGRGAIAVVRISGPEALAVADAVFRPYRGRTLGDTTPGRLRLGRAGVGVGDEVVAVRFDEPMPMVEIHCHGGVAAIAAVARSLEKAGAVRSVPGGLDAPPYQDRIRAEAMEDLASAPTLKTAEILLDQADGALSRSLARLVSAAGCGAPLGPKSPLIEELDTLIRRAEVGLRLISGWKLVIAGRPNVGKSRLFNALAGYERSIVNSRPGVTRDVVSIRAAFGGWPVELSDTAGERDSPDAIERLGIDRARQERRQADLLLLVLDRSEPLQEDDRELLLTTAGAMVVANKCDLTAAWDTGSLGSQALHLCSVSAETGQGLDDLVGAIGVRLVPDPPAPGEAVPFRPEHVRSLERARNCVNDLDAIGLVRYLEELGRIE